METLIERFKRHSTCRRCGGEFDKLAWKSVWVEEYHYKTITCLCGLERWQRITFLGSGHDSFVKDGLKTLESAFDKVLEG